MTVRPRFTVFTPTYNRAHTLARVYEGLKDQSFKDLEWLIIDDGSTDGTEQLVGGWQKESGFPIRYYYQQNRGKHCALNRAVMLAAGELFLSWDSDDSAVPEALARFWHHWNEIPSDIKDGFSGVTCLCQDERGAIVGDSFPVDVMDSDELEMPHRYKVRGEKWGFHRTAVLRRFPFPEYPGVDFIPEGYVWDAIAKKYKKRFVNEPLRVFYQPIDDGERLSSITTREPHRHAAGRRMFYLKELNEHIYWARYNTFGFLRMSANYVRFSRHLGIPVGDQWTALDSGFARVLFLVAWPVGWWVHRRDG